MLHGLPDVVDAWRLVARGERLSGRLQVAKLGRLSQSIGGNEGYIDAVLTFGKTQLGTACLDVDLSGSVMLECRRTMTPFSYELVVENRLALVTSEAAAQAVEGELDTHVVAPGGLRPQEVVEDELILALPIMPLSPAAQAQSTPVVFSTGSAPEEDEKKSPFAALEALRKTNEQEN